MQEPRPVPAIDLDHGWPAEALLSKITRGGTLKTRVRLGSARDAHLLQFAGRLQVARDGRLDPLRQPLQAIVAVERQSAPSPG